MKVLLVGSGGREHALAWSLSQSSSLGELHAAPGNPGIAALASCHPVRADDPGSLVPLAAELRADLVVVGPEAPLVAGLADELRRRGLPVFGPGREAAQIEGSKAFAKDVMAAAGVPTARTLPVARPPCVVKADGLAAGKGVWVCRTQSELDAGLRAAEALGQPFHVEELLEGKEVSVFALCDGTGVLPLPSARDYKRIGVRHVVALDPEHLVAFRFEDGSLLQTQFTSLDLPTGSLPFDTDALFQQLVDELNEGRG